MKRKHKPSILKVGGFIILLFAGLFIIDHVFNSFVDFDDVSNVPKYASIISKSYKTRVKLIVHGVNMDKSIGKEVHQYTVTSTPGFGGREVITRGSLGAGSVIRINKVLLCNGCYLDFGPRIKMQVDILSEDSFNDHNVYLRTSFGDVEFLSVDDGITTMSAEHFEKL